MEIRNSIHHVKISLVELKYNFPFKVNPDEDLCLV